MRPTRIILIPQVFAALTMAPVLFYYVACSTQPYHMARAVVLTFVYLAISGSAALLIYRARSARQVSSERIRDYSIEFNGFAPRTPDQRIAVRVVRRLMVAISVVAGVVLLIGFRHALTLRECTAPMPGWTQTSATVTRFYSGAPIAVFRAYGHAVYFTALQSSDVLRVGDVIRVTYQPGYPYVLHDLSVGQAIWEYPLFTALIALIFVLTTLVAGLTLTDKRRLQRPQATP